MSEKAHRFIAVGGKTFYFNINQTHGGTHNYLTIVAQKGKDSSQNEKLTMFPNQIGSFVHCLLETYAELCRRDEIGSPFGVAPGTDEVIEYVENTTPAPSKVQCPECGISQYNPWDETPILSGLNVQSFGTDHQDVAVICQNCGWEPASDRNNVRNGALFPKSSKEGAHWAKFAYHPEHP